MCGGYESANGPIREAQVDTIVWLDLDRPIIMRRVIRRTVRRSLTREELWNGNREPLGNFTRWDPEKNIIRWSWTRHPTERRRYEQKPARGDWDHVAVHRLHRPTDVAAFLTELDA